MFLIFSVDFMPNEIKYKIKLNTILHKWQIKSVRLHRDFYRNDTWGYMAKNGTQYFFVV